MKKIRIVVVAIFLILCIVSCSKQNNNNEVENSDDFDSKTITIDEDNKNPAEDESDLMKRDYTISPYVVIGADVQVILKTDGTVYAKGLNERGELGNGERVDSSNWVQVKDLENIIGIYAFDGFGNQAAENEDPCDFCYALNEKGDLYRWGANILTPEKMTGIPKINKIKQFNKNLLVLYCENDEKYLIEPETYSDDSIISYNSLLDEDSLYLLSKSYNGRNTYVLIKNDGREAEYIETNNEGNNTFEESIVRQRPINLQGQIVTSAQNQYLYCLESKSILDLNLENEETSNTIVSLEWEASENVVKGFLYNPDNYYRNMGWTNVLLYDNGKIKVQGDNEYGQLGDGTDMDYYDSMLTIDDAIFKDIYYNSVDGVFFGKYIVALDDEYNIWCWGDEYGYEPQIVINNTDFIDVAEDENDIE